jgi:hypothetical protein
VVRRRIREKYREERRGERDRDKRFRGIISAEFDTGGFCFVVSSHRSPRNH